MSTFVLTNPTILLGGVDLTAKSNSISLTYEVETRDSTTFGSGGTRTNVGGLWTVAAEVGGFVDDALVGASIFDAVGGGPTVFQVTPTGVDGETGYAVKSIAVSQQPLGGSTGDIAADTLSLSGRSGSPLVRGTILHPSGTARTATGNGTARQVGAVLTGEKVYGALNVVAASGTTPTLDVVVESASDEAFTSPTSRLTFAQTATVVGEWKELAGPVTDTWWRVVYTLGGTTPSFKFGVTVGVR